MNARHLGIDAGRLITGGGSSGGTMAAFAVYNTTFVPDDEDVPSRPNRYATPTPPSCWRKACRYLRYPHAWATVRFGPPRKSTRIDHRAGREAARKWEEYLTVTRFRISPAPLGP